MYPYLSDLFKDFLGIELPLPIYSFGAMVALGAMVAAWLLGKELDRYYRAGLINGVKMPAEMTKKEAGKKGGKSRGGQRRAGRKLVTVSPSYAVWTVTIVALVSGFAGAKIFHALENLDKFAADPLGMLFSSGGFTFYGGLLVGTISVIWYLRKKDLSVPVFADSLAPGLMIAYGIGRMGCHLAGDGDWGIAANLALQPSWMPDWLWAETYPSNILGRDLSAAPVYPTPIYEFFAALVIFAILWSLRKHPFVSGWLFFVYLMFNGVERFLIEKLRVNNVFDLFGMDVTQAEIIASLIFLTGLIGVIKTSKKRIDQKSEAPTDGAHIGS
ncbi:MAG: prolipoprotein diacylglyceryl transferase family protein [Bacteroidota bacterium]